MKLFLLNFQQNILTLFYFDINYAYHVIYVVVTHSEAVGFMYVFSFSRSSWESVFSKSSEVVTAQELRCCQRVVQLCRDCLLVVYKFVADSRGSLSGLSPDWDDTRYSHFLKRP